MRGQRYPYLPILLITLIAFGIRAYGLGADSLWFDEVQTSYVVQQPWLTNYERDHPPLLYWLVKTATILFDDTAWSLRLPSLFVGLLAIPTLFTLGKIAHSPATGLWASWLLALAPFHLRHVQEVRHYALLTTFTLLSTLFLYLALRRPQYRWWLLFGFSTVLSLYTHYGAFLVLATHLVVIAGWLAYHWFKKEPSLIQYPVVAGLLIFALYLPWLPNFYTAIVSNVGESAIASTGMAPVNQWVASAYVAFGFQHTWLAALTLILALVGFVSWYRGKKWLLIALVLALLVVPLFLITTLQIARWSLPKYIIYMLPVYLLAAGAGLALIGQWLSSRYPERRRLVVGLMGVLLTAVVIPQIAAEHRFVKRDWQGAIAYIAAQEQAVNIFVVYTLDLPDGFNQGGIAAPYYLDRTFADYIILDGYRLTPQILQELPEQATVWLLVLDRHHPLPTATAEIMLNEFDGSLFILNQASPHPSPVEQLRLMLEHILPVTDYPAPHCLLQRDLVGVYLAQNNLSLADNRFQQAVEACPISPDAPASWLMEAHLQAGDHRQAASLAQNILQQDRKDARALEAITAVDLYNLYQTASPSIFIEIEDENAPEPIQTRRYTMPHDGDWGDVIFMHPPASISFHLTLPDDPVAFYSRAALAPESWAWGGDGSTFVVTVTLDDGSTQTVLAEHIGNTPAEQRWHELHVSLTEYAGQTVAITLMTDVGAEGDGTGDWAGWETPRLIWQP